MKFGRRRISFACPCHSNHSQSMLPLNAVVLLLLLFFLIPLSLATQPSLPRFAEAPHYRNGENCPAPANNASLLHIAMTLDAAYLRGTIAAVHSVLRHATCPQNLFFHFIAGDADSLPDSPVRRLLQSTFPSLRRQSRVHLFREGSVSALISASVRPALERPLNYARNYLGDILVDVERVIYLDSDLVVVDDIAKLWRVRLPPWRVIAAPEYCHANLSKYFTGRFWASPVLSRALASKRACYFNTGVMLMNLVTWRKGRYTLRLERWMRVQKSRRIYELGSLPPFLLVFGGEVEPLDQRWNHHGLGGDNVEGVCRELHEGPVSLLHWSGKGKPWLRLDSNHPCPLDRLWQPYDLFLPSPFSSSFLLAYPHHFL